MTTNIDNIPMKTNSGVKVDDSDDPIVKDILNEFQQELKINNGYQINYDSSSQSPASSPSPSPSPSVPMSNQPQVQQYQKPVMQQPMIKSNNKSYYNEEYVRKSAIIIIIIGMIFSPIIYDSIIEHIPSTFTGLFTSYNFYIKSFIAFIAIYLLYLYKLV
jgi:hypothetical protein